MPTPLHFAAAVRRPTALAGFCLLAGLSPAADAERPVFADATAATGLDFRHFTGASGRFYFPEIAGAGGALFDADGDGDLDLFLVQGSMLGPDRKEADSLFPVPPGVLSDRFYRNDLAAGPDGRPRVRFVDATREAGFAGERGYGMGAAVGDVDGDGRPDLYVTHFGPNRLWLNRGGGRFEDATARAGVDDPRWSVPAVFFDLDLDGDLDLYVGNYVDFTFAKQVRCTGTSGAVDYCSPRTHRPETGRLFLNRGDGTFTDATAHAGLAGAAGAALGAVAADFDGDGRPDLYVANDGAANFLWINRGDGTFVEEALLRGCALNADGQAQASMGVDAGDFDGDGDLDLFMTHLTGEHNTLYVNDGRGNFVDRSMASGLGAPSWKATGFGTAFFDYDNDGRLDLLAVNGAVKAIEPLRQRRDPYPYHQPAQLFRNLGDGRFAEVTAAAGPALAVSEVGRGALFGDLDNDGDTDVVVTVNNGPARVLLNEVGQDRAWIGLVPGLRPRSAPAEGARLEVRAPGRAPAWRTVRTAASYASAVDPRVLVGLGESRQPVEVRVHWPGGPVEAWANLETGRYHALIRGRGRTLP